MRSLNSFARRRCCFHPGKQLSLIVTFSKRIFATAFGVMFAMAWTVTTMFAFAQSFVDHDISFKEVSHLVIGDALFPSIEQDGTI